MAMTLRDRLLNAWLGRISGCMLGKPLEVLSMTEGRAAVDGYLDKARAAPLRDYVPLLPDTLPAQIAPDCCYQNILRAEPDDDINYSVLALMLLEEHGAEFTTADVARAWLQYLPGAMVFTAERDAYVKLLERAGVGFTFGAPPAFDLEECSDNEHNDWIGAQIRADLYGWVLPGEPVRAAKLAERDAKLSHRDEGVYGAQAVAAIGAAIPASSDLKSAVEVAASLLPSDSDCVAAMELGVRLGADGHDATEIHDRYDGMSPVHTVNNLALVVWGLVRGQDSFSVAIGDTVAAGLDTDCNGATVGGLWGLTGRPIPDHWTSAWAGRVATSLAGTGELSVDDLADRTAAVAQAM